MRTYAQAVAYAESQRVNPSRDWTRLCQMFSRNCVGAAAWAGTARNAFYAIPERHRFTTAPRAGSLVYFDDPRISGEAGHAVFMVTNGYCYSNDILVRGKISKVPLSLIREKWGMRQLGWIDWTPSGAINLAPVSAPVSSPSPWSKGAVYQDRLKFGMRDSDSVRRLQYQLRKKGYSQVVINGNYGATTDAAVRAWQKKIGHIPDAIGQSFLGPVETKLMFPVPPYVIHM